MTVGNKIYVILKVISQKQNLALKWNLTLINVSEFPIKFTKVFQFQYSIIRFFIKQGESDAS